VLFAKTRPAIAALSVLLTISMQPMPRAADAQSIPDVLTIANPGAEVARTALQGLLDGLRRMLRQVEASGQQLVGRAGSEARATVAELERALASTTAPLIRVTEQLANSISRAQVLIRQMEAVATRLVACTSVELNRNLRVLDYAMTSIAYESVPWNHQRGFIGDGHVAGHRARTTIRRGEPTAYTLNGVFPGFDRTCGRTIARVQDPTGRMRPVVATVVSSDPRAATVQLPALRDNGQYVIAVAYPSRSGIGRTCDSELNVVEWPVIVRSPTTYSVIAHLTPSAPVVERSRRNLGRSDGQCGDGSCYVADEDGQHTCEVSINATDGWHFINQYGLAHCNGHRNDSYFSITAESGRAVLRGSIGDRNGSSGYNGWVTEERIIQRQGPERVLSIHGLRAGSSVRHALTEVDRTFSPIAPVVQGATQTNAQASWSFQWSLLENIDNQADFSEATAVSNYGSITSSHRAVRLEWDPQSGSLSVTVQGGESCEVD
jgi:hypothetical protein